MSLTGANLCTLHPELLLLCLSYCFESEMCFYSCLTGHLSGYLSGHLSGHMSGDLTDAVITYSWKYGFI